MDMFFARSDLDVSINFGDGVSELPRDSKLQILERFAEKLRSLQGGGHVRNVVSILSARVPIVRFLDQRTSVECDLAVDSKESVLNSRIIQIISQIDDRFQKLCLLIKHWAKAHDVNSALRNTLNSISIPLLVAHHLQTQDPPILPPFSLLFKDGVDPPNVEKRTQEFLNREKRNKESLGRLFVTFFVKSSYEDKDSASVCGVVFGYPKVEVYHQPPHHNYRCDEFKGHHNKRPRFGNGDHITVRHRHGGEEPIHAADDDSHAIDLPPPPPPFGRVYRIYCDKFGPQNLP
ncbi:hypothetical protein F2Q68_00005323 [Brassica cretica]|uniref:Poly(A) RNA polymerase mitochondrial-like central palm domain-containing protein n=1 Tax=Brassica cretica TaxID=69181 RepID=A0A8S9JPI4_BRACR|nr:hypothetical protein F2Q68_00005323 [Brassica cretica]